MANMAKRKTKAKKTGRKSKVENINAANVSRLASYGCTQTEIADFYGVNKSQISRSFATEFTKGREDCKQRLRMKQVKTALKGNVQMLIWLGKQMLEQREPKQEHNITGNLSIADIAAKMTKNGNG